jgi:hypothetical protein
VVAEASGASPVAWPLFAVGIATALALVAARLRERDEP